MKNFDNYLKLLNISQLTPVQEKCIEPLYDSKPVFALAPTGSGKTLAFILPLLLKIQHDKRFPQVIVLVPTRELGVQIAGVAQSVANAISETDKSVNILVRSAFGGTPIAPQALEMRKDPHVIIATPGRFIDLLERDAINLKHLQALVLDEADVMVGMGFSPQIEEILNYIPMNLQIALFSATQNEKVTELEELILKNIKFYKVDLREKLENKNEQKIKHEYIITEKENKEETVFNLLAEGKFAKGILFCHRRETVQQLAQYLKARGLSADALSGELGQVHRNSVMRNFKTGNLKFLIATNIAARGIDVSKLPIVIHYDIPYQSSEYIHRSGRTGRAGEAGVSLTICEQKNVNFYFNLMKELDLEYSLFKKNKLALKKSDENLGSAEESQNVKFIKLFVNKGKQDKMRPGDIVGAFIKELSLEKADIGNIYIFDHFTHVEVNTKKYSGKNKIKVKNMLVSLSRAK